MLPHMEGRSDGKIVHVLSCHPLPEKGPVMCATHAVMQCKIRGWLTKKCTRPFPRFAVFGIRARFEGLGAVVGVRPSAQGAGTACDFRR
jgi:hypothetical protein